jgi:hypothetical protein
VSPVMVTVAPSPLTVWPVVPLAPRKLPSPLYVAVSVLLPFVVEVRLQEPAPEASEAMLQWHCRR